MISASHLCRRELPEQVPAVHPQHEGDSSTAVAFHAYGDFSGWKHHTDSTEDLGYYSGSPAGVMSLPDIQKCWTKGHRLQINPLCGARAVSPAWPGCSSHRHSPTLQMACTDAVNQPHPDVPHAAHLGSACWEAQPRSPPSPGAARRQPPHTLLASPAQHSKPHPAGKPRGDWKSHPPSCFPANISSHASLLLTKRESERGAVEGWEHPCAQPGPHAVSPQQDHPSPALLSPS